MQRPFPINWSTLKVTGFIGSFKFDVAPEFRLENVLLKINKNALKVKNNKVEVMVEWSWEHVPGKTRFTQTMIFCV